MNSQLFKQSLTILGFLALAPMTSLVANAQPQTETPSAQPQTETPNASQLISISFAGGTVQQYVQEVRKKVKVNVVLDDSVVNVVLPEIMFDDVPVKTAVTLLQRFGDESLVINVFNENSLFMIDSTHRQPAQLIVLSVKSILAEKSDADLLSAIEIGMNLLDPDLPPVQIKLHSETGLLFAKGGRGQLSIITDVVNQLTPSQDQTP